MDGPDIGGYSGRLIRSPAPQSSTTAKPAEVSPDRADAESARIIARAEALAETILARAESNAAHLLEQAEAKARREREETLAARMLELDRAFRRDMDTLRPELARLVIASVKSILDDMPAHARFESQLRRALEDIEQARAVRLHVAREDHEAVLSVIEAMARAGETSVESVIADSGLEPGMCRLQAGGVSLDLSLSTQFDVLEKLLMTETDLADERYVSGEAEFSGPESPDDAEAVETGVGGPVP